MILLDGWMNIPISYFSSHADAVLDADMLGIKATLYTTLNERVNPFTLHYNHDAMAIDLNVFNNLAIHVYKLLQFDNSLPLAKTCEVVVCFPQFTSQQNYFEFLVKDYFEFDQKYGSMKFQLPHLSKAELHSIITPYLMEEQAFEQSLVIGKIDSLER